ncbi:unnamed protein product, partial [Vitis vinifera]|uniref:Uncharacterized protein n=1 Tax=Vitis vinifera TaxID=29760 RepID=D7T6G8_VITVI
MKNKIIFSRINHTREGIILFSKLCEISTGRRAIKEDSLPILLTKKSIVVIILSSEYIIHQGDFVKANRISSSDQPQLLYISIFLSQEDFPPALIAWTAITNFICEGLNPIFFTSSKFSLNKFGLTMNAIG